MTAEAPITVGPVPFGPPDACFSPPPVTRQEREESLYTSGDGTKETLALSSLGTQIRITPTGSVCSKKTTWQNHRSAVQCQSHTTHDVIFIDAERNTTAASEKTAVVGKRFVQRSNAVMQRASHMSKPCVGGEGGLSVFALGLVDRRMAGVFRSYVFGLYMCACAIFATEYIKCR
jgi:hypothetical protein